MNMRWKVDIGVITLRQGSFGNTAPSSLSYHPDDYYKGKQRNIWENYFLS